MKSVVLSAAAALLLVGSHGAMAQTSQPGASGAAPGQKQTTPGTAKKYAPGQKQTTPGTAKKYAPGQKRKQSAATKRGGSSSTGSSTGTQ